MRRDGSGKYLAKGNKWSASGAERKSGERERSCGDRRSQKTTDRERSAELGWQSGNGAESGGSRNALSVERLFWPLTLR